MTATLEAPDNKTTHERSIELKDATPRPRGTSIYSGTVVHRRFTPTQHEFRYRLFMVSIDLDEVETVFRVPLLCSTNPLSVARFRRADYFGDSARPLGDCVREFVRERAGIEVTGPIRLLTHLRYFGFVFNPVSFYYCFDSAGARLEAVVAEVTNTPWGERHHYVIPCSTDRSVQNFQCPKEFHVSPFMPMELSYVWRLTTPAEHLAVHIGNHDENGCVFDVTLQMERRSFTPARLLGAMTRFPVMTARVVAGIYWQAFRLWWKESPLVPHPKRLDRIQP